MVWLSNDNETQHYHAGADNVGAGVAHSFGEVVAEGQSQVRRQFHGKINGWNFNNFIPWN